ncbi:MAG: lysophospholipid acyltransferase family protein, partial [Candidatus Aminicenantes bacterium]
MRTVVLFIVYVLIAILLIPIIFFCFLVKWPQPLFPLGKGAVRLGQWILGMSLEVSGLENVDKKVSYVFMCNHLSALDGPLLFMIIPQPIRVILKKESFRIPIIGQAMRLVGFVPVDRKGLKGGKKSIDQA